MWLRYTTPRADLDNYECARAHHAMYMHVRRPRSRIKAWPLNRRCSRRRPRCPRWRRSPPARQGAAVRRPSAAPWPAQPAAQPSTPSPALSPTPPPTPHVQSACRHGRGHTVRSGLSSCSNTPLHTPQSIVKRRMENISWAETKDDSTCKRAREWEGGGGKQGWDVPGDGKPSSCRSSHAATTLQSP